jgi:K+-sensing histidine kinase KdpD
MCKMPTKGLKEKTLEEVLHKAKSPLTAIKGYADMAILSLSKAKKNEKALNWLDQIKKDCEILNEIISEAQSRVKNNERV